MSWAMDAAIISRQVYTASSAPDGRHQSSGVTLVPWTTELRNTVHFLPTTLWPRYSNRSAVCV